MKQYIHLIIASVIGGLIALVGMQMISQPTPMLQEDTTIAKRINNNINVKASNVPFDFAAAAELATKSVVHIKASESSDIANQRRQGSQNNPFSDFFRQGPKQGTGSGVIVSEDGYIVTNNHVVEFADEVEVTLTDNRTLAATIVGTYPKADLAVLKIEATNLPVLSNADSDKAKIGEWVLAVGNPLELNSTVTAGIISAKGRSLGVINQGQGADNRDKIESFIQTDAAVNPGNSGGALVDAQGRLLGINTAIKSQTGFYAGYSFAIPVNLMQKIVDDIIEYGSFQRAYLGIQIFDLDSEYAEEKGLRLSQGVVIDGLADGGSAQYAGLLPGDIIVEVNNMQIKSVPELQEIVGRAKVGEIINVGVFRDGKNKEIPVHLKSR